MNTPQFMGMAGATKSGSHTLPVVCQLLFSGVFERFTDIKLLLVESNIGWIPTLLEQVDDMFYRYRFFTNGEGMRTTPSRIFHRNFWASFMIDTVGMDLRHRLNVDQIMWSTDYPHTGSDWPNSRVTIERNFRGVPKAEVKKMLHDNCRRLYKLDHVPEHARAHLNAVRQQHRTPQTGIWFPAARRWTDRAVWCPGSGQGAVGNEGET